MTGRTPRDPAAPTLPPPPAEAAAAGSVADAACSGQAGGGFLRLDDQLCFALYAAGHALGRVYRPLLEPLGLTYPQYLVLLSLWETDGQRVSSLGDALGLDSGTLTPLLKRLAAAGLVDRRRSRDDEREVHVTLTEAGRALQAKAAPIPAAIGCAAGGDAAAIAGLKADLDRLRASLEAAVAPPRRPTRRPPR